ncbi:MAG: phosphatase PAP2 family protein [Deltaproteobacteria bacterium]|nr:phosphatase PAP2 family protein [Deltaproteobacteria bacterium]
MKFPRPTGHALAMFGLAVVASLAFGVIAREIRVDSVDQLDIRAEMAMHEHLDSKVGDAWALSASFIGSTVFLIPVLIVVGVLAWRNRKRAAIIVLAVNAVAVMLGDVLLKRVFARDRPQLFDKIPIPKDYSFPSGHSMSAVGVWGVIAAVLVLLYPRHKVAIVATAVPLILSIGLSRIYLGVHWPFDVLGGFLAGTPPLLASIYLLHEPQRQVAA